MFALSAAVDGEIAGVLNRPRFARAIPLARGDINRNYGDRNYGDGSVFTFHSS